MKRTPSLNRGFTMVEILLVVIILGVVAGLALPSFQKGFNTIELQTTAEDLAYTMRYGQTRAISQKNPVFLEFDLTQNRYRLVKADQLDDPESSVNNLYQPLTGKWGRWQSVPSTIVVELNEAITSFYPDGTIGDQLIRLCRGRCMNISTLEQVATVKVYEE